MFDTMHQALQQSFSNHLRTKVFPEAKKSEKFLTDALITGGVSIASFFILTIVFRNTVSPTLVGTLNTVVIVIGVIWILLLSLNTYNRLRSSVAKCHGLLMQFYKGDVTYEKLSSGDMESWLPLHQRHKFTFHKEQLIITNTYQQDDESFIEKGFVVQWKHDLKISSEIHILKDRTEKYLGKVARLFQNLKSSRPKLVHLENQHFEKKFRVYCNNKNLVKELINETAQQQIAEWRAAENIQIRITEKRVFVHYNTDRELLPATPRVSNYNDQKIMNSIHLNYVDALKIQSALQQFISPDIVKK